jgi:uncharacterized protein YacL (UPF0231 family)
MEGGDPTQHNKIERSMSAYRKETVCVCGINFISVKPEEQG